MLLEFRITSKAVLYTPKRPQNPGWLWNHELIVRLLFSLSKWKLHCIILVLILRNKGMPIRRISSILLVIKLQVSTSYALRNVSKHRINETFKNFTKKIILMSTADLTHTLPSVWYITNRVSMSPSVTTVSAASRSGEARSKNTEQVKGMRSGINAEFLKVYDKLIYKILTRQLLLQNYHVQLVLRSHIFSRKQKNI